MHRSSYCWLLYYTRCFITLYCVVHTVGYCTMPVVYVRYTAQFIRFVTVLYPLFYYVILRSSYCWLLYYAHCLCTLYCAVYTVRYCTMPVVYVRYTAQFIRFVAVLYPLFMYVILHSSYGSLLYYTRCLCTLYCTVHTVRCCTIPVVYVRYTAQFIRFVAVLYPLFMYVILHSSYGSLLYYTRCFITLYCVVHTIRYCTIPVVYVRYTAQFIRFVTVLYPLFYYVILRSSYYSLLYYTRCVCTLYCAVHTVRYCTIPVVYVRYTPQFIRFVTALYPLFMYVILRSSYGSLLHYTRCLCTLYSAVHTVRYCTIPVVYVRYTPQFIRFVTVLYPLFMCVTLGGERYEKVILGGQRYKKRDTLGQVC